MELGVLTAQAHPIHRCPSVSERWPWPVPLVAAPKPSSHQIGRACAHPKLAQLSPYVLKHARAAVQIKSATQKLFASAALYNWTCRWVSMQHDVAGRWMSKRYLPGRSAPDTSGTNSHWLGLAGWARPGMATAVTWIMLWRHLDGVAQMKIGL